MTVLECRRETQQRAKRERFGGGVGGRGLYLNPAPPLSPGRELGRQGGSCIRKPPAGRVSVRDCGGGVLSICDNIEDHASEFCSEPLSVNHCIPARPTPFFETDAPAPASGPPLQRETSCRSASRPGVIDSATHEPQPTPLYRDCRTSSSSGPTPDDQDSQTACSIEPPGASRSSSSRVSPAVQLWEWSESWSALGVRLSCPLCRPPGRHRQRPSARTLCVRPNSPLHVVGLKYATDGHGPRTAPFHWRCNEKPCQLCLRPGIELPVACCLWNQPRLGMLVWGRCRMRMVIRSSMGWRSGRWF